MRVRPSARRRPGALHEYDAAMLELASDVRPPTERERAFTEPVRIRIIEADAGTRYPDLAEQVPEVIDDPEGQLRLLNGDWPEGEPGAGEHLKMLVQDSQS